MGSVMKFFTRILGDFLLELTLTSEEQQEFRKNRFTVDVIFVIHQIVKKLIEFNKLAFICFVDLIKARVRLNNIIRILKMHMLI